MQEENGEEDTGHKKRESEAKKGIRSLKPNCPGHIADYGEGHVDVSKLLTETDTGVFTTTANVESGESEESNRGEDNEGGMSVEDLQRGFISEVQSAEEGKKKLWSE